MTLSTGMLILKNQWETLRWYIIRHVYVDNFHFGCRCVFLYTFILFCVCCFVCACVFMWTRSKYVLFHICSQQMFDSPRGRAESWSTSQRRSRSHTHSNTPSIPIMEPLGFLLHPPTFHIPLLQHIIQHLSRHSFSEHPQKATWWSTYMFHMNSLLTLETCVCLHAWNLTLHLLYIGIYLMFFPHRLIVP